MKFLDPNAFWYLLAAVPVFLILAAYGSARARFWMKRLFSGGMREAEAYTDVSHGKRFLRRLWLLLALIAFGIAAARPAWGKKILPDPVSGRDIAVVADVSRSMLSDNVRPSRMEHMKQLLRDLVGQNGEDRFSLIAFAGNAELICPMTADHAAFLDAVNNLSPASAKRGGTNLEAALKTALLSLEGGAKGLHRAVLLISDGGELEGTMSKLFASYEKAKIPVLAVGVGEPGSPALIPLPGENGSTVLLKDRNGNTVNAALEEKGLAEIAAKTGGLYLRSTTIHSGLQEIQNRIGAIVRENGESDIALTRTIEHGAIPIFAGLIFLALYFLTGETKHLPRRHTASMLVVAVLLGIQVFAYPQENEELKTQGLVPGPAAQVQPALPEPPPPATASEAYNRGVQLQKSQVPDNAAPFYETAIGLAKDTPEIRAKSYLNLGVLNHTAARKSAGEAEKKLTARQLDPALGELDSGLDLLKSAEENYRESLRSNPQSAADAARNQTILIRERKKMEERKAQIEELKKKLEEAQKQAQKANEEQQKKQNSQQKKQEQTKEAQKAAEQLQKQAQQMEQKPMEQSAKEAAEKLKEAQAAQQKNDSKQAQEAIREALRKLGLDPDRKDQQKQQKQGQDGKDKKDDQKKDGQKKPKPQDGEKKQNPQKNAAQPVPAQPREPSPEQKNQENRMEMMRQANEKFQKELKERRAGNPAIAPVEKDW